MIYWVHLGVAFLIGGVVGAIIAFIISEGEK